MIKKLCAFIIALLCITQLAWAQGTTTDDLDNNQDLSKYDDLIQNLNDEEVNFDGLLPSARYVDEDGNIVENTGKAGELGRKIEEGTIELKDIPIFIVKAIDFITKLGLSIAVIALIYGGGQYMFSEILGTKEAAKKTILYAIGGIAVMLLSWLIVNIVKVQLTGVDYFGNLVS